MKQRRTLRGLWQSVKCVFGYHVLRIQFHRNKHVAYETIRWRHGGTSFCFNPGHSTQYCAHCTKDLG